MIFETVKLNLTFLSDFIADVFITRTGVLLVQFQHSSLWPAFTQTVKPDSVSKYEESSVRETNHTSVHIIIVIIMECQLWFFIA